LFALPDQDETTIPGHAAAVEREVNIRSLRRRCSAAERGIAIPKAENVQSVTGKGITGMGRRVSIAMGEYEVAGATASRGGYAVARAEKRKRMVRR
jgi:hypothetical protein